MMMQHKDIKGEPVKIVDGSTYAEHQKRIESQKIIERFDVRWNKINRNHLYAAAVRAPDDAPWITLAVTVRRELAVENILKEAGVEVLVPMRMTLERKRRYRVIPPSPVPVMLGYVLVRCPHNSSAYMGLMNVESVHGIVGGHARPLLAKANKVKEFNELALSGAFDERKPDVLIKVGATVTILYGVMSGLRAKIVSTKKINKGEVTIELDLFGRITTLTLPLAMLDPL